MKLIKYRRRNPWLVLDTWEDRINKLFDFPFSRFLTLREDVFTPSLDVWEDKDNIYVEADLPGFDQKDIKVNLKGDNLVISAQRQEKKEEKSKRYYHFERFQGEFYRQVGLPASVDASKVKAEYKKGVLKLTLPKKEDEKYKEIKIDVN